MLFRSPDLLAALPVNLSYQATGPPESPWGGSDELSFINRTKGNRSHTQSEPHKTLFPLALGPTPFSLRETIAQPPSFLQGTISPQPWAFTSCPQGGCKKFKLCGGVIKKQNKTEPSPKCLAQGGLSIEGLFSLHCGILSRSVQDFFFF